MPHLYGGLLLSRGQLNTYLSFYGYYPPLYDLITAASYETFGVSLLTGRIAVTAFTLLSIWVVFEFANRTYGPKIALVSSILLGSMPGFYWSSRFALLESMLLFFFTLVMFFFFTWITKNEKKMLVLCGLALGIGFLAKYQILIAVIVMIVSILVLFRDKLKAYLTKIPLMLIIALAIVVPWLLVIGFGHLSEILYVIQAGGQDRTAYSVRFPIPIFYLVELTWPYNNTHPIFLPIFILGLAGLALWGYRRKREDQFFLTWFISLYVLLTLIPNRQWRYAIPLFSVLAISAASFVFFAYSKIAAAWKSINQNTTRKKAIKIASGIFVALAIVSIFASYYDGYSWAARYEIFVPLKEATDYVTPRMNSNQSILVLGGSNSFYEDMVRFYLYANESVKNKVLQYPKLPVDAFQPTFDLNQIVDLCQQNDVKFVLLYEYGATMKYYNSTIDTVTVWLMLYNSQSFKNETIILGSKQGGDSISIFSYNGAT